MSQFDYNDFYEENRHTLVKSINPDAFLAQLRSSRIISEADEEDINNRHINTNKFMRTGKFLDILKTKGENGFLLFKKLLAWECPHVFKACFIDEAPPPPPEGYKNHDYSRISSNLHEIFLHGIQLDDMRIEHNDMLCQMKNLQELLEFAQNDKKELENEIQRLRTLETLNRQLSEKSKELEKENKMVKEENRDFMRKNITQRDEIDEQANQILSFRHKIDELERQLDSKKVDFDRLNECQNELKENFEKERRESQRLHEKVKDLRTVRTRPVNIARNNMCVESDKHLQTKVEILKADLEAERDNNRSLVADLEDSRKELYKEKDAIKMLMTDIYKLRKDVEKCAIWQRKAEQKNEDYFRKIQQLQAEKRKIEKEKLLCQQKHWDLGEEKNDLFQKKHELERKLEKFQREYDKLKDDIMRERLNTYRQQKQPPLSPPHSSSEFVIPESYRLSHVDPGQKSTSLPTGLIAERELAEMESKVSECPTRDYRPVRHVPSVIAQHGSVTIEEDDSDDEVYADFQQVELMTQMSISSFSSQDSYLNENFVVDDILPENSPARLYKIYSKEHPVMLTVTLLSSLKLVTNGDSIEVGELKVEDANLNVGDTILQILYSSQGRDIKEDFITTTLESACKSLQKCIDAKPQKVTVYIRPGETSKKKILEQGKIYIRSNIVYKENGERGSLPLSEGEVTFFQNVDASSGHWHVSKIDQKTGRVMKISGLIPNMEEAKKFLMPPKSDSLTPSIQYSSRPPPLQRKPAIRNRECKSGYHVPYVVVMPMKACIKLPVMIQGPDNLVTAILDLIKTTCTDWAKVLTEKKRWSAMLREEFERHMVFSAHLSGSDCNCFNRCIIINVVYKANNPDLLQKLFGKPLLKLGDGDIHGKDNITERSNSGNFVISENLTDPASVKDALFSLVQYLQNSIFWVDIDS